MKKKTIKFLLTELRFRFKQNKEYFPMFWPKRRCGAGRFTVKRRAQELQRNSFLLRAAEKQIPMPVKIKTSLEGKFSGWWNADGTYHVSVHYNAYCQNCGRKVEYGVKGMSYYEHNEDEQYCQYCGQKLWWPKN